VAFSRPEILREIAMRFRYFCFAAVLLAAGPALAQPTPSTCQRQGHERTTASPQHAAARQAMHQACAADLAKYCANVAPGCGRPMQCLKAHQSEVSSQCAQARQNLRATRS
jgi:Cysteine rich repeat